MNLPYITLFVEAQPAEPLLQLFKSEADGYDHKLVAPLIESVATAPVQRQTDHQKSGPKRRFPEN